VSLEAGHVGGGDDGGVIECPLEIGELLDVARSAAGRRGVVRWKHAGACDEGSERERRIATAGCPRRNPPVY
jgi:hypothetical protein